MMRYAAIPWPLAGLFVAVALVGQETLLNALGTNPSLSQTAYRMLVATIGVTSLALILLPPRRIAYLLGAIPFGYLLTRFTTGKDVRTEGSGNIDAADAAQQLVDRIDALTPETTGTFWHANSQVLPW